MKTGTDAIEDAAFSCQDRSVQGKNGHVRQQSPESLQGNGIVLTAKGWDDHDVFGAEEVRKATDG